MAYNHKEESKRFDRCWDVLSTILASTITPEAQHMPANETKMLWTLAEAVLQYIGKGEKHLSIPWRGEPQYIDFIYKQVTAALAEYRNTLHQEVKTAIDDLTKPIVVYPDGPDHAYTTCDAYTIFKEGIRPLMTLGPTFSPPYDWVMQAKQKVANLPAEQRKDIEGIAKILREIWQKR